MAWFSALIEHRTLRGWAIVATVGAIAMATVLLIGMQAASATHPEVSLAGSNFEIDTDANLIVDDDGQDDWANVDDIKAGDKPTGRNDDSYSGGVKEDTVCPGKTTGSIPNNKSDLRFFGVHEEAGEVAGDPGFLHIFWTRVAEPSGATLMDFEFNKSQIKCDGSPNITRTVGDLLIEYKIEGGTDTTPDITLRKWLGTAWGPADTLDPTEATGSINLSPITNPTGAADNSDGTLPDGTTSEDRIFGEASIDLDAIFDENKCESFGSAMLKSRAGPPFDSQLKDFILPQPVDIQNCANVIIRKQTLPDEDPNTTEFGYTKNFNTDPTSANTFTLKDDGVQDYEDNVVFGTGYTVTEDVIPAGWEFTSLDCSASNLGTGQAPSVNGTTVTFDINSDTDVLDCTYTNTKPEGALKILKNSTKGGAVSNAGAVFSYDGSSVTDNGAGDEDADVGEVCVSGLAPGDYNVNETTPPDGYGSGATEADQVVTVVNGTNCTDNQPTGGATAGVVTFVNPPLADLQVNFRDGGSGETFLTSMTCENTGTTPDTTTTTGWDDSVTHTGISIDPSPRTVTCTIVIDP